MRSDDLSQVVWFSTEKWNAKMLCQIVWCRKFNKAENRQTLTPVSMISYTWASSPVVFTENFSACSPATMATRQPFEDISCIPAPYKAVASKLMQPSKELLVSKEGLVWRNIFWSLWMIINHPTVTTVSLWIPFVQSYWPWVCVFQHTRPRLNNKKCWIKIEDKFWLESCFKKHM